MRVDPLAATSFVLDGRAVTAKNALFALFDGDHVLLFVDHVVLQMAVAIGPIKTFFGSADVSEGGRNGTYEARYWSASPP